MDDSGRAKGVNLIPYHIIFGVIMGIIRPSLLDWVFTPFLWAGLNILFTRLFKPPGRLRLLEIQYGARSPLGKRRPKLAYYILEFEKALLTAMVAAIFMGYVTRWWATRNLLGPPG